VKQAVRYAALTGVLACCALSWVAGCGSESDSDADADANRSPVNVASAVCAKDASAKPVGLPTGFPSDFPLPPGTLVYAADDRGKDGIVVTGVTRTPFKSVLSSLQTDLPAHGFTAEEGETEPHDAESNWHSAGFTGRWAIREIPQCSGETLVNVLARANSSASPSS
jgi:hypothetical protein